MKTIKEIQEEAFHEQPLNQEISKKDESIQKEIGHENQILTMASVLNKISLTTEPSKPIKKDDNQYLSSLK